MRRVVVLVVSLFMLVGFVGVGSADAASHHRVVLGHKHLYGKYGIGWGHAHPKEIFNGGDPNGDVSHIAWKHWGTDFATGKGKGNQFRPNGGYYAKQVKVQLRAKHLARCYQHGPRTYTVLKVRFQVKPGSSKWTRWYLWNDQKNLCKLSYS